MKLQPDRNDGVNTITRHDSAGIRVGATAFAHSVLVPWQGHVVAWAAHDVRSLLPEHFDEVLRWPLELLIFGSGQRLRFVPPALMRGLIGRRIGFETMDTAAACRTYNVLAGEGRAVVAALIIEAAG